MLGSMSGTGYQDIPVDLPLFINLRNPNLGMDPALREIIVKSTYQEKNLLNKGTFTHGYGQQLSQMNKKPLIIVPGLGVSNIYAKWDFSETGNVKNLDTYGNFESKSKWSCRSYQDQWVSLWFPKFPSSDKLPYYCWSDNVSAKVTVSDSQINGETVSSATVSNKPGLVSVLDQFGIYNSMKSGDAVDKSLIDLVTVLESQGYVVGINLFIAWYDFRLTLCDEFNAALKFLVENVQISTNQKAVLIGHDLGSVMISQFLSEMTGSWKMEYIDKFISLGGSFGGCPKALRVLLSGDTNNNTTLPSSIIKNFTGVHLMLPCPKLYSTPLLTYSGQIYSASDIPTLLKLFSNSSETIALYNTVHNIQLKSLQDPGVPVFILAGTNLQTESFYNFTKLQDPPQKLPPYYSNNMGSGFGQFGYNNVSKYGSNKSQFNSQFNSGDGTIPDQIVYWIINTWKKSNSSVNFKFYSGIDHINILSSGEVLKDLIHII